VPATPDGAEPARKRRRRGGRGRRRGEAAATHEQGNTASAENTQAQKPQADAAAAKPEAGKRPRLMSRLGQGIKSLVNRLPLPGRRR
jgi:hypothetical protein